MPPWAVAAFAVFGLAFLAVAALVFVQMSYLPWQRSRRVDQWHPTPCRVVDSRIDLRHETPEDGPSYDVFDPRVRYAYEYKGPQTCERITLTGAGTFSFRERPEAERWLASYPLGATMTCLVDPEDPSLAVLDPAVHWGDLAGGVVFAGLFAMAGLIFLLSAWMWRR